MRRFSGDPIYRAACKNPQFVPYETQSRFQETQFQTPELTQQVKPRKKRLKKRIQATKNSKIRIINFSNFFI